jgi:nucleoid-associated protein YgaU
VQPGDTLSRIILRTYGAYSTALLKTVLAQNPDISEPDQILVGQVIQLPDEKTLNELE